MWPIFVFLACLPLACSLVLDPLVAPPNTGTDADGDGDSDGDSDGDGDSDADSDGDSDADSDGDGDADSDGDSDTDADADGDAECIEDVECDDDDPCTIDRCSGGLCDHEVPTDAELEVTGSNDLAVDLGLAGLDPDDIRCTSDTVILEHLNEDFEGGLGVFTIEGTGDRNDDAGAEGSGWGTRLCSDDSVLDGNISLEGAGEGRVMVAFSVRNINLGSNKYLLAEYSLDDSEYHVYAFVGDEYYRGEWHRFQIVLPPETGPNEDVWLRFRRYGGPGGSDCADVDDVVVRSWLYDESDSPLVDEDFDSDYGAFREDGEDNDVTRVNDSIELKDNRDGAMVASFSAPGPHSARQLVIRWAWQQRTSDELNENDYILAQCSEDQSTWHQMGVIGFGAAPSDLTEIGALVPDELLDRTLWIRFIAPSTAETSSSEGALVDDVVVAVDELTGLDDDFEPFVDHGDGTYRTEVDGELHGLRQITCRYQCGDGEPILTDAVELEL